MKRINSKGFTLIELLAVITIMGILMLVAIPAISRTIDNSRRDTFITTTQSYINAVKNAVAADEIYCGSSSISAREDNFYYIRFDSFSGDIMEKGGKSSWGNNDVKGVIIIRKKTENNQANYSYYIIIVDEAGHGIGEGKSAIARVIGESELNRDSVKLSDDLKKYYNTYSLPSASVKLGYEKDAAGNDLTIKNAGYVSGAVPCNF